MRAVEESQAASVLAALVEARQRTLELVADLSDEQLLGPRLPIVNPLLWELGHVAWFQERWLLRHLRGRPSLLAGSDALYDSSQVHHDTRWDLPLPSREQTLDYLARVLERIQEEHTRDGGRVRAPDGYDELYFLHLALFHEYMHAEAFAYTRQTLGYPPPRLSVAVPTWTVPPRPEKNEDIEIPGAVFLLGNPAPAPFVFDNEREAHAVRVRPFRIARFAVSNAEFAEFVEAGGYRREEFWTLEGWRWRQQVGAEYPVYWQREASGRWLRRHFDRWVPLEPDLPVLHVNWFEAAAYCRWAGRRLPTEAEWELAASGTPEGDDNRIAAGKRRYPWGDQAPRAGQANLDWSAGGGLPVYALPDSDSAFGVRQMVGNVWEWTADWFQPYPGFSPGPYRDYSAPWFGDHKVLRGGCWATRSLLITTTYRNFYRPDRRDVWAGFRTCAL